jgi:hypothetical protein
LPEPQQAQNQDPISDLTSAQQGLPIKAFQGQDHKAHIAIKQAFLQDPSSGGSPMMQSVGARIQANIQEHMLMQFIEQAQAKAQMMSQAGQQVDPNQALGEAASQIAVMNQQNLEQQMQNQQQSGTDAAKSQAALMLAHAEVADTQIKARKQQFDEQATKADLLLRAKDLAHKQDTERLRVLTNQANNHSEVEKIVTTKNLDATIAKASKDIDHRNKQAQQHQQYLQAKALARQQAKEQKDPEDPRNLNE